MVAIVMICVPLRLLRVKHAILSKLELFTRSPDVGSLQVRLAVVSGVLATLGFLLSPSGNLQHNPEPLGVLDDICGIFVLLATVSCAAFAIVTAWAIVMSAADGVAAGMATSKRPGNSVRAS
jgi:hypothetical protein